MQSNTPKSGNRHHRRAQKAESRAAVKTATKILNETNSWDVLEGLYQKNMELFGPIHKLIGIIDSFKEDDKSIKSYLTLAEQDIFNRNIDLLRRDIISHKEDLTRIHDIHKGRTGPCSIEDWALTLEITEKYQIYTMSFEGVVRPVYDHLADLVTWADLRRTGEIEKIFKTKATEETA